MKNIELTKKLIALIKTGNAFDLSWSQTAGHLERRCGCGWDQPEAPIEELAVVALGWGLPEKVIQRWLEEAQKSDLVGVTINSDRTSLRLYTHTWRDTDKNPIIYRGFKGLPDGTVRIDDYAFTGDLRDAGNWDLAITLCNIPDRLEVVAKRTPPEIPLPFTRIQSAGRVSWLCTVRHAKFDAGIITPDLNGYRLAHLAGGIDASKGAFDSFYISSNIVTLQSFLSAID